jgi:hypothetical protein
MEGTSLNYIALSKEKKSLQRLIVGPWWHVGQSHTTAGEAEIGAAEPLFHRTEYREPVTTAPSVPRTFLDGLTNHRILTFVMM